jgi:hypothetical protein
MAQPVTMCRRSCEFEVLMRSAMSYAAWLYAVCASMASALGNQNVISIA